MATPRKGFSERAGTLREGLTGFVDLVAPQVLNGLRLIRQDGITLFSFLFLSFVVFLGIVGPHLAPYPYDESLRQGGELLRNHPPSLDHPLGTNDRGEDVLSRILYGARPTMTTGLLGGAVIISVGSFIGVTAGYIGGRVDNLLMRFTDLVYGIPLLPAAILVVAFLDIGFITTIMIIGLILWRSSARVLRSQVLQIKQRPFIQSAKATGASTSRIIFKHILPNIAPMGVMFFAIGVGYSILLEAGLSFLGLTDPFYPSWGQMIRNAYDSGYMDIAWWWSLTPGFLISLTVMSAIMLGRGYESLVSHTDADDASVVTT
jgi:peptide/nickel transport system permease protein